MKKHIDMEYDRVDEYLYLGTNLCCTDHAGELITKNIRAELDLEEEAFRHHEFTFPVNIWIPVKDKTAPTAEQLRSGVYFLDILVRCEIPCYVHCMNGHGRGPTFVIGYYIFHGMSFEKAYEFVKSKRNEIHLENSQEKTLQEFERAYDGM
ncbi:MAG: dual specificity protein phosphatase family protein [Parcubacteria group bacterium]|nr:dual specificity protein phosphatase family protein [Parcubacteria group bacterium]